MSLAKLDLGINFEVKIIVYHTKKIDYYYNFEVIFAGIK